MGVGVTQTVVRGTKRRCCAAVLPLAWLASMFVRHRCSLLWPGDPVMATGEWAPLHEIFVRKGLICRRPIDL